MAADAASPFCSCHGTGAPDISHRCWMLMSILAAMGLWMLQTCEPGISRGSDNFPNTNWMPVYDPLAMTGFPFNSISCKWFRSRLSWKLICLPVCVLQCTADTFWANANNESATYVLLLMFKFYHMGPTWKSGSWWKKLSVHGNTRMAGWQAYTMSSRPKLSTAQQLGIRAWEERTIALWFCLPGISPIFSVRARNLRKTSEKFLFQVQNAFC